MKINRLMKLTFLELVRFKSMTVFLILNLSLGLVGFYLLQIFQQSLTLQSAERAQAVLGGDISISARRAFSANEVESWKNIFRYEKQTHTYSLFSMLRTSTDSRLVNVLVFDDNYPLYGKFKLSEGALVYDEPRIWVDPEVLELLQIKKGQWVEIGNQKFLYSGVIEEDPTRFFKSMAFAPRVLISNKYLKSSALLKTGSTFSESWSYKLLPAQNLVGIKSKLEQLVNDPGVRISTTQDSSDDSNRILKYFSDYLGLVALVALGLCFLCGSYLMQWFFLSKKKNIAIYKTLGLSDCKIVFMYLLQNLIISVVACFLSVVAVESVLPVLQQIVTEKFKLPLSLVFDVKALLFTTLIAVLGPVVVVVPQILQIINLRPLALLHNLDTRFKKDITYFLWLIVVIVLFWVLSVWQSNSFKIATYFTIALIGLILFFQLIIRLILFLFEKASAHQFLKLSWKFRYAIKGLTRRAAAASLVFTTMSLATLVLSLLPHIKSSIISEVRPLDSRQRPSLFLFDIQPEQTQGLQKIAFKIFNQNLILSPLVRSRILKINNKNFERATENEALQTREVEEGARFRNRGVNLTYRSYLQASESITKGSFASHQTSSASEPTDISLEKRYAERMGIQLGDVISFDVQGLELEARVSSFRQVRWTSFQPNFFILFPTGVLEEAPQVFLTSVASDQAKLLKEFQKQVMRQYNNISIIDVARTLEVSLKYIDQMALALQFMAWLAVLVGLFVFVVLLNTQIKERLQEMNLLQILGSETSDVLKIVSLQFSILIVGAIGFGVLLGFLMAWMLVTYLFDIGTVYDFNYLVLLLGLLLPICMGTLYFGLKPLKKLNPMDLIRQI